MAVWRNARQRRLYGKPDDLIDPGPNAHGNSTSPAGSPAPAPPPPPPKRVKREKTRPESEYELVNGLPVTETEPDYSLLTNPRDSKPSQSVVGYAIHASRQNYLNGTMFDTLWSRKVKGQKRTASESMQMRDKMARLHDCTITLGPHTFPVKLFTVRDDTVHEDEEADAKVEALLRKERGEPDPVKEEIKDADNPETDGSSKDSSDAAKDQAPRAADASKPEPAAPSNAESISAEHLKSPGQTGASDAVNEPTKELDKANAREPEVLPDKNEGPSNVDVKQEPTEPPKKKRTRKTKAQVLEEKARTEKEAQEAKPAPKKRGRKPKVRPPEESGAQQPGTQPSAQQGATQGAPQVGVQQAGAQQAGGPETRAQRPAPGAAQAPAQRPAQRPAPQQGAPTQPPDQLVVYRLQQMAARDPDLSALMRLVASGTADTGSVNKFQEVINQVKADIANSPLVVAQPKPVRQHYPPRMTSRAIILAFEFDENPYERFLLPKRSIIEYVSERQEVLWSFLHVANDPKKGDVYTPVTVVFHQIPSRIFEIFEKCVRKPDVVRYYMKETMSKATRAVPWNLWFRIEKNDEILIDLIRKMPVPMMPPPPLPKKQFKPRKPRAPTMAQLQQQHFMHQQQQWHMYMMWLAKVKQGQPLNVPPMLAFRRGEPMIHPPSFLMRPVMQPPMPMMRPTYSERPAPPDGSTHPDASGGPTRVSAKTTPEPPSGEAARNPEVKMETA